ncbi:MAG: hypothetical protein KDA21_04235, partial [Phycisphaerales bacterium]|nr:hypothetical protein [Phycisphaerales bacterium]
DLEASASASYNADWQINGDGSLHLHSTLRTSVTTRYENDNDAPFFLDAFAGGGKQWRLDVTRPFKIELSHSWTMPSGVVDDDASWSMWLTGGGGPYFTQSNFSQIWTSGNGNFSWTGSPSPTLSLESTGVVVPGTDAGGWQDGVISQNATMDYDLLAPNVSDVLSCICTTNVDLIPIDEVAWTGEEGAAAGNKDNWEYGVEPTGTLGTTFSNSTAFGTLLTFQDSESYAYLDVQDGTFTFEMAGNQLGLTNTRFGGNTGDAIEIGSRTGLAASLTVENGTILTGGEDVTIGVADNANATLTLRSNARLDTGGLGTLRVGTSDGAVHTGETLLDVEAGSTVRAGALEIADGGTARLRGTIPEAPGLVAVGAVEDQVFQNPMGAFEREILVNAGGTLETAGLAIGDTGLVRVDGAEARLIMESFPNGDITPAALVEIESGGTLVVSDGGSVKAATLRGNGTLEVSSGEVVVDEFVMGLTPTGRGPAAASITISGADAVLSDPTISMAGDPLRDGLKIGATGEASLSVTNGGHITGTGLIVGSDTGGVGNVFISGGNVGTSTEPIYAIQLGEGAQSSGTLTAEQGSTVSSSLVRLGDGAGSSATLRIASGATMMASEVNMLGNGDTTLLVERGGSLLLPDLAGMGATGILLGKEPDEGVAPATATALITGQNSLLSAHADDLQGLDAPALSELVVKGNGRAIVSSGASLRIGGATVGTVEPTTGGGGLLRITNAHAEFFGSSLEDDTTYDGALVAGRSLTLDIIGSGTVTARNEATVVSHDVGVAAGTSLVITNPATSWSGTNFLVQGTLQEGAREAGTIQVSDGAALTAITLEVVNGGDVIVKDDASLTTTGDAHIGGGEWDEFFTLSAGGDLGARVTIDGPGSEWNANRLFVGGSGADPNIPDASGELMLLNAASITADTVTIASDGSLTGSGQVSVVNPLTVDPGGTLGALIGVSPIRGDALTGLVINGDLSAPAGSNLTVELAGTGLGERSALIVTGDAMIDGRIILEFVDGFGPRQGDIFEVIMVDGAATFGPGLLTEVRGLAPGFLYDVAMTNGTLMVTALNDGEWVPTPGPLLLAGTFLTLTAARRRRRSFDRDRL